MISRGLRGTKTFYKCGLAGLYHMVILKETLVTLHCTYSFNLSKVDCQLHEVIGQDGSKPHECDLKSISLVDLFLNKS